MSKILRSLPVLFFAMLAFFVSGGELAAQTTTPPGYSLEFIAPGYPAAINSSGEVIGSLIGSAEQRSWVYSNAAGYQILPLPEGMSVSRANDINDLGVIVGSVSTASYYYGDAVVWTPNVGGYDVAYLDPNFANSESVATAVNNLGDIVGTALLPDRLGRQSVWFNGPSGLENLSLVGFTQPPVAINAFRQIIGGSLRMDLDALGVIENLDQPDRYLWTTAADINASGQVVSRGYLPTSQNLGEIARYTDGIGWEVIGGVGQYNSPGGLNDNGDAAGYEVRYCYTSRYSGYTYTVYLEGLGSYCVQDLLLEPFSDWSFYTSAGFTDINNAGQIVLTASNAVDGRFGAAILTPDSVLPPPAAPSNLTAEPHEAYWQQPWNAMTLTWSDNSSSEIGFSIERRVTGTADWAEIDVVNLNTTSYWDMTVDLGVTYDYRVSAFNLSGNSAFSNIATQTAPSTPVDTEDPLLSFVTPAAGAIVEGNVSIVVEASDNVGLNFVEVRASGSYYDEVVCSSAPNGALTATLNCSWNTTNLEAGAYTLSAYASDEIGNGTNTSIQVAIETATPTLTISAIDMSAKSRRGTVNVTAKVKVIDQSGSAVRSAMVYGTWTLPDGSNFSRVVYTDRKGVASFTTSGGSGTYTLGVTNVIKSGYGFDAGSSVLTASITR